MWRSSPNPSSWYSRRTLQLVRKLARTPMKSLFTAAASFFVAVMSKALALVDGKQVREISVAEICEFQNNPAANAFILVDVRTEAEISVSTIPNAITRKQLESSSIDYRGRIVVTYCTIGGRSLLYARQLSKRGIDARNFRAGIIGWCVSGLPLVTPQGDATNQVHTHTALFRVPPAYEQVT